MIKYRKAATISIILILATSLCFAAYLNFNERQSGSVRTPLNLDIEAVSAEDIVFTDENGNDIALKTMKGKVVFINFWATWCGPCIAEMPGIHQLKQSYKNNPEIIFLLVDVDGNFKRSKNFMKKKKFNLPVCAPKSDIPPTFLNNAIPATVVLNKAGEIAGRIEGGYDYTLPEIKKALDKLIEE